MVSRRTAIFLTLTGTRHNARGPGWEEPEIAGAQPPLFAVLVRDEDLAGDHHNNFVLTVMALEAPRRAFPHDDVGRQVVAPHNLPGPRYRNAA